MLNPETDLLFVPVSDQEVKAFLGHTSLPKPYGNKMITHTRSILDIIAKDMEIRAYFGADTYLMADDKFEAFKKVLGPLPDHAVRPALAGFINDRMPGAIERTAPLRATPSAQSSPRP